MSESYISAIIKKPTEKSYWVFIEGTKVMLTITTVHYFRKIKNRVLFTIPFQATIGTKIAALKTQIANLNIMWRHSVKINHITQNPLK